MAGNWKAYAHLLVFQYHVILIYCSHIKCMTSEPGVLPKDYEELDFNTMSGDLKDTILAVKSQLRVEQRELCSTMETSESELTEQSESEKMAKETNRKRKERKVESMANLLTKFKAKTIASAEEDPESGPSQSSLHVGNV